jgi:predicted secreted protein
MATPFLGREFVVIFDSSVVGLATDFTFSVDKKTVDITSLASAGWVEKLPMDKEWKIDFNGLVSKTSGDSSRGYNYIMNSIQISDASVYCAIKPIAASNTYWAGNGYLTSCKMQGGVGKQVTFSGAVEGTGATTSLTS